MLGWPLLALALAGAALCADPGLRRLLWGLWGGYLVFGTVFTHHAATHDYYHLPLVPLAGLSVAALAARVAGGLGSAARRPLARLVLASAALVLVTGPVAFRVAETATEPTDARLFLERGIAPDVGRAVGHTPRTLVLGLEYGKSLQYHGRFSGLAWPKREEIEGRGGGLDRPRLEVLLEELRDEADALYFVVTDLEELGRQPELERLLSERYEEVLRTALFRIWELRSPP